MLEKIIVTCILNRSTDDPFVSLISFGTIIGRTLLWFLRWDDYLS